MESSEVEVRADLLQWDISETATFIEELFAGNISRKFQGSYFCLCSVLFCSAVLE